MFSRKGGASALKRLFQRAPCRVLFPSRAAGDHPEAVLLNTSGGVAGGDRVHVAVAVEPQAAAVVTTQAAEKVYRSLGPSDGARLERRLEANVAATGRLIASEMITFGRLARGERFASGLLLDRWRVHHGDRLVWADALRLEAGSAGGLEDPLALSGARAIATVIYVAGDAADQLALARSLTAGAKGWSGASLVNGMLLARFLAKDPSRLRVSLARYLAELRHAVAGLPARTPRLWRC